MLSYAEQRRKLNIQVAKSLLLFLLALVVAGVSTYAWYVYNTSRYTTDVDMAAGSGKSLYIADAYDGKYGSAIELKAFMGRLTPVSTNRITGGFQKVKEFEFRSEGMDGMYANVFERSNDTDYYMTSLYLRSDFDGADVYLSNIGFEDKDSANPISSAIRVGFVVHSPGQNQGVADEHIFEISQASNPKAKYNTATGSDGYVLDSSKTDGTTVPFSQLTSANYCEYNKETGEVSLKAGSKKLLTLSGGGTGKDKMGTPVQVDVYVWLEGCDKDCTLNLVNTRLDSMSLEFACYREEKKNAGN